MKFVSSQEVIEFHDRLTYRKLKNQTIPLSTPYAT